MKSYVRETLARLRGNSDEVQAEKNYRRAHAEITGQLAGLNLQLIKNEQLLESAEEALNDATYPPLVDSQYLTKVNIAQQQYDEALERLDNIKFSIEHYSKLLEKFSEEKAD